MLPSSGMFEDECERGNVGFVLQAAGMVMSGSRTAGADSSLGSHRT